MIRSAATILLLALGMTSPVGAATLSGVTLPDTYPVDGQTLRLNGIGLRTLTIFGIRIYVAGLYTAEPAHDAYAILSAKTPKVLLLQYLHDGSKEQVDAEYRKGERDNCGHGECPKSDEPDFERLIAAAPAVNVGDTTTYIASARGLRVLANNRQIIDIPNPGLANRLLDGFIGAHPPSADLRAALLGVAR